MNVRLIYRRPMERAFRLFDRIFGGGRRVCQYRRRMLWWFPDRSQLLEMVVPDTDCDNEVKP